jgi:hypothetical protein
MKKMLKNKKLWVGIAVLVIVIGVAMLTGDSTPVDATTQC